MYLSSFCGAGKKKKANWLAGEPELNSTVTGTHIKQFGVCGDAAKFIRDVPAVNLVC